MVRTSDVGFLKAFAKLFVSFLRFWAKDMWISQKSFFKSAWILGLEWTVILITAESTFGSGVKAVFGTVQINSGSPKMWTWRESTECLPFSARIFSATSFCTMKTIVSGGLPDWNCSSR